MTNYRRALLRVAQNVRSHYCHEMYPPVGAAGRCLRDSRIRASQPMRCVLSLSLSFSFSLPTYFVKVGRWTVDASIIRKGLLVRVSCDLHSYPVALPASFPERKRIPSDYTGSGGCALIYIFPYVTYVYVHTLVVPPIYYLLSDIAIIHAIVTHRQHANSQTPWRLFARCSGRLTAKLSMITS